MVVYCNCGDCRYNKEGECSRDTLYIRDTFSAIDPASCDDYESEDWEESGCHTSM